MTRTFTVLAAFFVFLSISLAPIGAAAQTAPDYDAWEKLALRAEDTVEAGRASDQALEELRRQVALYRESFLTAQSANQSRIATLQSQLEALGPAPEDPATEPAEITQRRAELAEQLSRLRAPIIRAEEAYNRADGLVGEIDSVIRARQTNALLELGPTPLNPQNWPRAGESLIGAWEALVGEVRGNLASDVRRAELRQNLPLILFLLVLAGLLVARGRGWFLRLANYLRRGDGRAKGVYSFLLSLGQIAVPLAGLLALVQAAEATGLFTLRSALILDSLPYWGALILMLRWLADQAFARDDDLALVRLSSVARAEVRLYITGLGILMVARDLVGKLAGYDRFPPEVQSVLTFPILVGAGLMLFRLGVVLAGLGRGEGADSASLGSGGAFRQGVGRLLGRVAMAIAVVGPVMSAIGYGNAGTALVYPAVMSLALAALLLVLQRFLNDLYQMASGRTVAEADSLLPVLGGFLLTLGALPVLALIWGARVADLTEIWARFQEGFQLGETRISPSDFLTFVLVFTLGYGVTRALQGGLKSSVLPKTKIDLGGQNAIVSGVGYVGIFLAVIISVSSAGLDLSSLAIVAGALSVGIGFGLQNIVSNFVSGIILLIERPISEGDWIEVSGKHGYVKSISVRSTRIETFDRTDVIVPNADLVSGTVTNYTRGNSIGRVIVPVGVAYGTDTKKVESILKSIAREHPMVLMNPEPGVFFMGFGADSLDFEIRAILRDVNYVLGVKSQMNHEIARRFQEEGIEIPFAQRDVWLRNPEVLHPAAPAAPAPASGDSGQ